MITLAGIELNDSLVLEGDKTFSGIVHQQKRNMDGDSNVTLFKLNGGKELTLKSVDEGTIQGLWCSSVMDQINAIASTGTSVTLDYRGTIYTVAILGFTKIRAFENNVIENPSKAYVAELLLIEV